MKSSAEKHFQQPETRQVLNEIILCLLAFSKTFQITWNEPFVGIDEFKMS